jgi:hypothetical protein
MRTHSFLFYSLLFLCFAIDSATAAFMQVPTLFCLSAFCITYYWWHKAFLRIAVSVCLLVAQSFMYYGNVYTLLLYVIPACAISLLLRQRVEHTTALSATLMIGLLLFNTIALSPCNAFHALFSGYTALQIAANILVILIFH